MPVKVNSLNITKSLASLDDVLSGDIPADVVDEQMCKPNRATADFTLNCTRDLFERLRSNINAVQVGLEDVWVRIAQIDWLCSISCDPLRLTCCGENLDLLVKMLVWIVKRFACPGS